HPRDRSIERARRPRARRHASPSDERAQGPAVPPDGQEGGPAVSRIIGIDLGTTTSCVAVLDEKHQPKTVVAADGERTTPSWVAWPANGVVAVGTRARRQAVTNPSGTAVGAKRVIVSKVNTAAVTWCGTLAPRG